MKSLDYRLKSYNRNMLIVSFFTAISIALLMFVISWSARVGEFTLPMFASFVTAISMMALGFIYSYFYKRSILVIVGIEYIYQRLDEIKYKERTMKIKANHQIATVSMPDGDYKVRFQKKRRIVVENSNKDIVEEYQY